MSIGIHTIKSVVVNYLMTEENVAEVINNEETQQVPQDVEVMLLIGSTVRKVVMNWSHNF